MKFYLPWLGCFSVVLACQTTLSQRSDSTGPQGMIPGDHQALVNPVQSTRWAMVLIKPLGGSDVQGVLRFEEQVGGVHITGTVEGLRPGQLQAIHIHEVGDCQSADGSSAGGHFNPENQAHGGLASSPSHAGDLGNIKVDGDGVGELDLFKQRLQVAEGLTSIVGRSIIIHAEADDLRTNPSGNSGARVACGIIMAQGTDDP